jgi:5,10-methylenetetrahydrofolate reductase
VFKHNGVIEPTNHDDQAAKETIEKLGLNHPTLIELRRRSIRGAFHPKGRPLRLSEARRLKKQHDMNFQKLEAGDNVQLTAFCFAIRSALDREIRKLEGIKKGQ